MDSLFHFILAILACMAVGLHRKHGFRVIIAVSLIAVLIDVDHFIFGGRTLLHNIWFIALVPIILFFVAYWYEHRKKPRVIKWQSYILLLLVVLVSHAMADLFQGGKLMIPNTPYPIISTTGVAFLIGFVVILSAHFIEDFIYFVDKKHNSIKTAFGKLKSEV